MSDTVIKVEHLYKQYRLGVINHGMLYKDLQSWFARLRGKEDPNIPMDMLNKLSVNGERFLALQDVSFEVKEGDVLGIIGRNGAGKSTLLKIISRVTAPTKGCVKIKGRVASLLEVGTGFHPELTGRENVYLNGAILGMGKLEIRGKFDEIVNFSNLEKFIDTPVKRYSSGMYVRLAFAVAAHLEPEILLVDEVLAVGDIEFQKKCIGKMEEVSKKQGRTILFISHNMAAINSLCKKAMILDGGGKLFEGETTEAVNKYLENSIVRAGNEKSFGNGIGGRASFIKAYILNEKKIPSHSVNIDESFYVEMEFFIGDDVKGIPVPNYHFKTGNGVYAFIVGAHGMKVLKPGMYKARVKIPAHLLNDGMYTIGLAVTEYHKTSVEVHFFEENYLTVNVIDPIIGNPLRYNYGGPIPGVMRPKLDWEISRIEK